ncbi:MAG: c-type cytochrome [Bdellovibrionales bacterium]|nr:c-type cytochrome [Bdellovibrionales bacterium]
MAATDPKDTVYNTKKLSKWFAIASISLLIITIWAVIQDYDRPWKSYARQSQRIAAAIGERKLVQAQNAMDKSKLAALEKQIAETEAKNAALVSDADAGIQHRSALYYRANQDFQFAKGRLDALLFELEESLKHREPGAKKLQKEYKELAAQVDKLKRLADEAERQKNAALQTKKDILADRSKVEDSMLAMTRERDRLRKVIDKNEANLANILRNAPLVDFISPTVKINQVVLPHLKDDYFFNKVPRVDRCMTCHATIDKVGFEKFPQPFKSHPKLDLMVGPSSPHPVEKVGCTVCHAGAPQSADFTLAAHTPRSAEQETEWHSKYGYHRSHDIGTPMLPLPMTEGKCVQCHARQIELAGAPNFNAGMRLIERYGCYTCHKFKGHFEQLAKERKPGPTLQHLSGKLDPNWVRKWLWEPTSFRPSTLMPRYWKNHNNSDPDSLARGVVEVDAISHFLFAKSQKYEPLKLASNMTGDVARGKEMVGSVGCLGCHAVADFPRNNPTDPNVLGYKDPRVPMFGPELNQMGSKVSREWLVSWLANPKHYWEGTAMPSLKLSEQEVSDIAAYLLSKRNEKFEQIQMPTPNEKIRDKVVLGYLEGQMPPRDAAVKLASMSVDDKKLYLGEKMVNHYGCYGCHAITGFENAPNLGAELSTEGSKDVSKFAFENVQIYEHSRADWIFTKVRTPRIWDVGKNRDFEGKARMPQFNINHEQAQAIASIVLGYENKNVDDEAVQKIDGRLEQIIAGQRLIRQKNCIGCHALEKKNGEILALYPDDPTMGPPNLNTEGRKVQTDWLYSYLLNPNVNIRPWLKIRMPQFQMPAEHALTLTKYFAASDGAVYPFEPKPFTMLSSNDRVQAEKLIQAQGCLTCHAVRKPGEDVSAAAPHFQNIKARLRGPWVVEWLHDPSAIMPGTRMPTLWPLADDANPKGPRIASPGYFGDDADKQIEAIRNYLFTYPGEPERPSPRKDLDVSVVPEATSAQAPAAAR